MFWISMYDVTIYMIYIIIIWFTIYVIPCKFFTLTGLIIFFWHFCAYTKFKLIIWKNDVTWESDIWSWVFLHDSKIHWKNERWLPFDRDNTNFHRCSRKYFDNGSLFKNRRIYIIFTLKNMYVKSLWHLTFLKMVRSAYWTPSACTLNKKINQNQDWYYILVTFVVIYLVDVCESSIKISK